MSAVRTWGSTPGERAGRYPCDDLVDGPRWAVFRAVDVAAPAAWAWRWLCQLRAAPYSYDLLDNLGRRSPRALTPGLGAVAPGDRAMTIFRVAALAPGREITFVLAPPRALRRVLVPAAITYRVAERHPAGCRLVVKYVSADPAGALGRLLRAVVPAGDLLMMRRQLLNLRDLAERDAARAGPGAAPPA